MANANRPRLGEPASNSPISFSQSLETSPNPPARGLVPKGRDLGVSLRKPVQESGCNCGDTNLRSMGLEHQHQWDSKGASTGQEHQQQQLHSRSCLVMARAVLVASMADVSPILGSGAVLKTRVIPFC